MYTTLNKIRENKPCTDGWETLLKYLGKTSADAEPLSLLTILESNGVDDTLWCLRAVDGFEKEKLLLGIGYARDVEHLMPAESKKSLDVFERYANGLATQEEFAAAVDAARSAAWAADAADSTADAAAAAAAAAAAYAHAVAACAAAADAAYAHAVAAWAAATAVCAARAGAYAWAAADAAADAVYAHAVAARSADAAAARSTIKAKQETQLKQLLGETT